MCSLLATTSCMFTTTRSTCITTLRRIGTAIICLPMPTSRSPTQTTRVRMSAYRWATALSNLLLRCECTATLLRTFLTPPCSGRRVTSLGVLFDFTGNDDGTSVQKVEDMVKEQWVSDNHIHKTDNEVTISLVPGRYRRRARLLPARRTHASSGGQLAHRLQCRSRRAPSNSDLYFWRPLSYPGLQ